MSTTPAQKRTKGLDLATKKETNLAGPRRPSVRHKIHQWLKRVVGLIAGSPDELIRLLVAQVEVTASGVSLALEMTKGTLSTKEARAKMRSLEHAGDQARSQLVAAIGRALTTPIDNEDIFRASRSIDDVLDNLRDFVREADLFGPVDLSRYQPPLRAIAEGLERLRRAVSSLATDPEAARGETLRVRKASGRVRNAYEHELAALFSQPISEETLKARELLRRLDVVGLRLADAADALADGALKRAQ
jgi:uncharacterized protein Yka (UPF0111/DUF47 family)